jgi:hypothetical protein
VKVYLLSAIALGLALSVAATAQDAPAATGQASSGVHGRGQGQHGWGGMMGGGRGLLGTVTEAAADHYTIKTSEGETYAIHFSVNTRIVKGQNQRRSQGGGGEGGNPPQPIKASEIKVGDAIAAMGEMDANAKSLGAINIMLVDPERAKEMREMQANYGKTWLLGKVTSIDGVKVTLMGAIDSTAHSFVADENTTFRKHREPITLADIQTGDTVRVEGAVKNGTFLATSVAAMSAQGSLPIVPRETQPPPK